MGGLWRYRRGSRGRTAGERESAAAAAGIGKPLALRVVLKVLVQVLVLFGMFFLPIHGGLLMRGAEIRIASGLRTHRGQRDQLIQIFFPARRTFRGGRGRQQQILESVSALAAFVFIDRHERSI